MHDLLKKYKHGWILLYFPLYILGFFFVESAVTSDYYIIHNALDDLIPFCEYFIVPYLLWFPFLFVTFLYFFLTNKEDFYKLCTLSFIGMTIFLVVSYIFPNGHDLRPTSFEHNNIFTFAVNMIYSNDTPTNIFPSMHVFNSLAAHIAIVHSKELKKHNWVQLCSWLLTISITLSTMFVKQHSSTDVLGAFILTAILYYPVYIYYPKHHR